MLLIVVTSCHNKLSNHWTTRALRIVALMRQKDVIEAACDCDGVVSLPANRRQNRRFARSLQTRSGWMTVLCQPKGPLSHSGDPCMRLGSAPVRRSRSRPMDRAAWGVQVIAGIIIGPDPDLVDYGSNSQQDLSFVALKRRRSGMHACLVPTRASLHPTIVQFPLKSICRLVRSRSI
jgi:hypothetical protein